ncbi:GNAT family N-acetyltransferase [Nocardia sp. 2]|uniref:GNAT family N-acetyltransferase n=2 Tax=Nocardia acididurans TaxID=2802282 RepID=A0ABS1MFN3_9NOCA|nr:GNAT family N-acetyltransferase [Nocardia acididurans]
MLDTFYRVFGYGYLPDLHDDVIDLAGTYLDHPTQRLWVAEHAGQIVATSAIRARGPRNPPHPAWLVDRYPDGTTAQFFRVYVRPEHQRRGLASRLVRQGIDFVRETPALDRLYLHTDTRTPGALEFWQTFGEIVHDGRDPANTFQTVHLEIPLRHECDRRSSSQW